MQSKCNEAVPIPMAKEINTLNICANTVFLYQASRQRTKLPLMMLPTQDLRRATVEPAKLSKAPALWATELAVKAQRNRGLKAKAMANKCLTL